MPKFKVTLGRLVRETASVVVEAESAKEVESRLSDVFEMYEGDWSEDVEWGCQESDSHTFDGDAPGNAKVDVTLKRNGD